MKKIINIYLEIDDAKSQNNVTLNFTNLGGGNQKYFSNEYVIEKYYESMINNII